jgi:hypothetical protein
MGIEKRRAKRQALRCAGTIYARNGKLIARCELQDISATGAKVALSQEIELPREFFLSLSADGQVRRYCKLAWQYSILAGVQFSELDSR